MAVASVATAVPRALLCQISLCVTRLQGLVAEGPARNQADEQQVRRRDQRRRDRVRSGPLESHVLGDDRRVGAVLRGERGLGLVGDVRGGLVTIASSSVSYASSGQITPVSSQPGGQNSTSVRWPSPAPVRSHA